MNATQPEISLETGSAFGKTAHAIGRVLANSGHGELFSLEVDPERIIVARNLCNGLPVHIVEQSSMEWLPAGKIDFMWLDSLPHLRAQEIVRFREHASNRCVIGVHDTTTHPSIAQDLAGLVADGVIVPPLYLPTPRGVCFTRYRSN